MRKKSVKKPVVKATPLIVKSPAENYFNPDLFQVATEVSAIEDEFIPKYVDSNVADVYALATMSHRGLQEVIVNPGSIVIVDTGVSLSLPSGYQVRASANVSLARSGLFVSHVYLEEKRLKLVITNLGNSILIIPHKGVAAQIWVEPVYFLNWKK